MKKQKQKFETEAYPVNGMEYEKLAYIEKHEFKTMWKVKEMKKALLKKNDIFLANELSFFVQFMPGDKLFLLQFKNHSSQTFFTTDFKWKKCKRDFVANINKPTHKHFNKLMSKGKKYEIVCCPPRELTKGRYDYDTTCNFINS